MVDRHGRPTLPTLVALAAALGAALLPAPAAAAPPLAVDDFEDGDLDAASGLAWVVIADDLLGGGSAGEVEPVAGGAGGSRGSLRFRGRTAEGFAAPFAGAWVPAAEGGQVRDLSRYGGLRFRARGAGATFQAGVRRGTGGRSANYLRSFVAPPAWTEVVIPFAELAQSFPPSPAIGWTAEDVGWIGFTTAPGHAGDFALEIDDVEVYPAAADSGAPAAKSAAAGAESPAPKSPAPAVPRTSKLRLTPAAATADFPWRPLAADPEADGKSPRLPDARALAYHHDRAAGVVWFRIDLARPLGPAWFGVNLAVDADGDPANGGAWWGPTNSEFRFDRLVTVWVLAAGPDYQGMIGVGDAAGVGAGIFDGVARNGLRAALADGGRALVVGVPRADLGGRGELRVISTVGSAFMANDDLPDRGAVTLALD
jgi:hypothetical protein